MSLLSIKDVAEISGEPSGTISRWMEHGKLPSFNAGRSVFIHSDDISALIRKPIVECEMQHAGATRAACGAPIDHETL